MKKAQNSQGMILRGAGPESGASSQQSPKPLAISVWLLERKHREWNHANVFGTMSQSKVMVQYRTQVHITQLSSVSTPNPSHVFPGQSQSQANPKVFQHSMIIVKVEDTDFINRVTGNKEKRKKEKRGA